jgi:restriction system protein
MAIPTYDQLMRPVLELAAKEAIGRRSATDAMVKQHRLTQDEIDHKLPSGGSTIANRTGWAMTFLTKAALIAKIAPRTYQATEAGRKFLGNHSGPITDADLRRIPGYREAWAAGSAKRREEDPLLSNSGPTEPLSTRSTQTPDEVLGSAVQALDSDFRGRLLQTIVAQTPTFFEQLVLDVLVAMGYGGSKEDAAERLGQSGDEGIDGCINQDALGLDQVMVQAKRYRPDRRVPQNEIREFIGSLTGKGVTKGIFITTSSFAGSAQDFVSRGSTTKVVLVDGAMLIDLMVRYGIGTRVAKEYKIHEIDQNYFDEEE